MAIEDMGHMLSFAYEVLNQVRTAHQALADLRAKHKRMKFDCPGHAELAQMIDRLQAELALREERSIRGTSHWDCTEASFSR